MDFLVNLSQTLGKFGCIVYLFPSFQIEALSLHHTIGVLCSDIRHFVGNEYDFSPTDR